MADLCLFGYCAKAGWQKFTNKEYFDNSNITPPTTAPALPSTTAPASPSPPTSTTVDPSTTAPALPSTTAPASPSPPTSTTVDPSTTTQSQPDIVVTSNTDSSNKKANEKLTVIGIIGLIIYLIIAIALGIWAVKLSWSSNTLIEWGKGYKIIFAFFAFIGAFQYLVAHLVFKADLLGYIRKIKPAVAVLAAPIVASAVANPDVIKGGMKRLAKALQRK